MINNRSSEGNGTDASAVLALYRMGQQNRPDHPYHRSDLTGNPAHAFRSPKVSRATDIASPVFAHHLAASKDRPSYTARSPHVRRQWRARSSSSAANGISK